MCVCFYGIMIITLRMAIEYKKDFILAVCLFVCLVYSRPATKGGGGGQSHT